MTITTRTAATAALALVVLALSAATAFAGRSETITVKGGKASFNHRGEIFSVKDTRREGYSVRAYGHWYDADGKHPVSVTDPDSHGGGNSKNLSIREHIGFWMMICYFDGGDVVSCSEEQRGES